MNRLLAAAVGTFTVATLLNRAQNRSIAPELEELEASCDATIAEIKAATGPFHTQAGGTLDAEAVAQVHAVLADLRTVKRKAGWGYVGRRVGSIIRKLERALKRYEKSVATGFVLGRR